MESTWLRDHDVMTFNLSSRARVRMVAAKYIDNRFDAVWEGWGKQEVIMVGD